MTHVERLSEARKLLAQGQFDVILLDLVLPDKPRMGSLIEIHDQASRVPIVVLTGMDDETMEGWAFEEGAQDYLVKGSFDGEALVRCIRHAIQAPQDAVGRVPDGACAVRRTHQFPLIGYFLPRRTLGSTVVRGG